MMFCLATHIGGFASFISALEAECSNTKHPYEWGNIYFLIVYFLYMVKMSLDSLIIS